MEKPVKENAGGIVENTNPDASKELQLPIKVLVDKEQLNGLIAQNNILKDEVEALINVYMDIAPFFNGGSGVMAIMKALPKLMGDTAMQDKIAAIIPIIEKYKPIPNGENE